MDVDVEVVVVLEEVTIAFELTKAGAIMSGVLSTALRVPISPSWRGIPSTVYCSQRVPVKYEFIECACTGHLNRRAFI